MPTDEAQLAEQAFEAGRDRAAQLVLFAAFCGLPLALITPFLTGASPVVPPVVSLAFLMIGLSGRSAAPDVGRVTAALALIGQCIAFTAAFAGHPWQIDSHMAFFAALAVLVVMIDARAMLAGVVLTAVHHLSLAVLFPALIYPEGTLIENLGRVVFHAVIVLAESGALLAQIATLHRAHANRLSQTRALEAGAETTRRALEEAREAAGAASAAQLRAEEATTQIREAQARAEADARRAAEADAAARAAEAREHEEKGRRQAELAKVMEQVKAALRAVAEGDLTAKIRNGFPPEFEPIRQDFNRAVEQLQHSLTEIRGLAQQAHDDSGLLHEKTQDMWRRSERQAASVEQSSAALSELAASIRQAAGLARQARDTSERMRKDAETGSGVLDETIAAMTLIETSSEQISQITGLIDDISFQTNLLALNAGVEAARAGEAGRGFAVVATEVRALAQKSAEAAKEISSLISQSRNQVRSGAECVNRTGVALREVVAGVQAISGMVAEMAASTGEQSTTITELSNAIDEVDRALQTNVGLLMENSSTTNQLTDGTGAVEASVARFRISAGDGIGDGAGGYGGGYGTGDRAA